MTSLINFIILLKNCYPFHFILFTIFLVLLILIIIIFKYKNTSINYKVENIFITFLSVFIYIIIFVLLILYLRYFRLGSSVELLPLFEIWYNFLKKIPFLVSIILIELLFFFFGILIQIKKFLTRELIKVHLYIYFTFYNNTMKLLIIQKINPLTTPIENKYPLYNRLVNKLQNYWAWETTLTRIQWRYFEEPYCERYDLENIPKWLSTSTNIMLKYGLLFLLIIILLLDLSNKFTLHYIFYYLPFYFFYSLWKRLSTFLSETDYGLDFIIFERYYEDNVLYIDLTKKEEQIIQGYIRRGFRAYRKDVCLIKNPDEWNFHSTFSIILKIKRRFIFNKKTGLFENNNTRECVDPKDVKFDK